ncbi:WD40-repeat-containing domain protein [Protomyces lactucae-debilis]|uniref:WD40-repeat-containing domain protein n=1 Tax=Protomyces lactucae-debilis TaxID=2754530 RepID=A0A1Y2FJ74_PROLT|nr:WD40-repeat-containing domain protein [Protomyces lactucae-debilis]ORY83306.1 WD40-repeat-containing domain protein [Protomyces lactucae-debilis]
MPPAATSHVDRFEGNISAGVASPESLSLPSPSASPKAVIVSECPQKSYSHSDAGPNGSQQAVNMMQLPVMLDSFEHLPPNVQSYALYQILKRCNKRTLQMVASVVNPALKRDFLDLLPYELSLHVLSYLDVQSLCRALQVSKRWRQLIDEDEYTWKRRLDIDQYDIEDAEFEEALQLGWVRDSSSALLRRPRAISTAGPGRPDMSPYKELQSDEAVFVRNHFQDMVNGGLKQPLVGQQIYKTIYRKHHTRYQRWMNPRKEPQHISFESHGRHVVTCLQLDDDKIITGSEDSNINIFDARTGALRVSLQGHEGGVWALQYMGDILVSGSTDRTVRVWDIPTGRCLQTYDGHTSTVRCLLLTAMPESKHGEQMIITGSRDSSLKMWKLPKAEDPPWQDASPTSNPYWMRTLEGHSQAVRAIAAEDDVLVSGSYDCSVRVWKVSTGVCLHRLTGHTQKVYSVVLDAKRGRCISGSMDWKVKVWDLDVGACLWTLEGHTSLVGLLSLSNERLVSAAADSTLRVWDPNTGKCMQSLTAHTGAITCFQHDGDKIISGSDGTLKLWDGKTGKFKRDLLSNLSYVWQVKFDERRCVAAVQRNNMTFIEVLDFGC